MKPCRTMPPGTRAWVIPRAGFSLSGLIRGSSERIRLSGRHRALRCAKTENTHRQGVSADDRRPALWPDILARCLAAPRVSGSAGQWSTRHRGALSRVQHKAIPRCTVDRPGDVCGPLSTIGRPVIGYERSEPVLRAVRTVTRGFRRDGSAGIDLASENSAMIRNECCHPTNRHSSPINSAGGIDNA